MPFENQGTKHHDYLNTGSIHLLFHLLFQAAAIQKTCWGESHFDGQLISINFKMI